MHGDSFKNPFNNSTVFECIYEDRNYNFFTMLCGVRQNMKCKTIVDPQRGLPDDMSEYATKLFNSDYLHDVGYATLTELLEYNWESKECVTRVCSLDVYKEYLLTGEMNIYCRSTSMKTIEEKEAKEILESGINHYGNDLYVRVVIESSIHEYAERFYSHVLPKLCQLSVTECDGESDDVRILFGFDS